MKFVRIKPFNPAAGQKCRSYTYRGKKYLEKEGWYECPDDAFAAELRKLRADETDPYSPKIFDVVTPDQAHEIDTEEMEIAERRPARHARPDPKSSHKGEPKRARKLQGSTKPVHVEQPVPVKVTAKPEPVIEPVVDYSDEEDGDFLDEEEPVGPPDLGGDDDADGQEAAVDAE